MIRFHFLSLLAILSLAVTTIAPVYADDDRTAGTQPKAEKDYGETYRYLNLFGDVFERVRAQYVEEQTDKELIENAINGMLTQLDPHSAYLNEEKFKDMQVETRAGVRRPWY